MSIVTVRVLNGSGCEINNDIIEIDDDGYGDVTKALIHWLEKESIVLYGDDKIILG